MSNGFPGAEAVTAPGAEAADLAPAADPMTDAGQAFLPHMDAPTFDGLFNTNTKISSVQRDASAQGAIGGSNAIVDAAKSFLGTPYAWGGTSARGVDCSGLVYLAYKAAGITLPRVSFEQANAGQHVALNKLRAGDLVAWDLNERNHGADHIAISLGGDYIIEAAKPGTNVRIRKLGSNEGAWGVRIH